MYTVNCDIVSFLVTPVSEFVNSTTVTVVNGVGPSLSCNITSRPSSSVNWYFNQQLITSDGVDFNITESQSQTTCGATTVQSTLDILRVNFNNTGNITCSSAFVTNETNWKNQTTIIDVECKNLKFSRCVI